MDLEHLLQEIESFLKQFNYPEFTVLEWEGKELGFRIVRRLSLSPLSSAAKEKDKEASPKLPLPITSEFVGIFHFMEEKPTPGMPLRSGQSLGYVESVNVKHSVEAKESGQLQEILVEEGSPIEYGQVLFTVLGNHVP